ncbi:MULTISPECIES: VOC family protein [Exiguobacterium]|uniref:VOC family protein n=1 Tax=unclassified Exiguobacterium TaxID=2644629 RepID=UPI001BE8E07B|nr:MULTISPECIES: VOC family protein [unclassified Exiguobacterium]
MRITEATLYTNRLDEMKRFYTERLGLSVSEEDLTSFRINLGEDALVFQEAKTEQERQYHTLSIFRLIDSKKQKNGSCHVSRF